MMMTMMLLLSTFHIHTLYFRMSGTIVNFNSVTKAYTIQWDEDDVKEEFSDLDKVDELVKYATEEEKEEIVPVVAVPQVVEEVQDEQSDNKDEDDKDYDWNNDVEDEDLPAARVEEDSPNTEAETSNTVDNKDEPSPYQGSVPENFDFGYTYKYDNLGAYESWPVGTPTLLEFQDGYYEGKIQSFDLSEDKSTATYSVIWSDDTSDKFVNELEWMDLMVENAEEYEPWEPKT
jgi:hypothetical protein